MIKKKNQKAACDFSFVRRKTTERRFPQFTYDFKVFIATSKRTKTCDIAQVSNRFN
uniref:Uncharacterized protein n=1 Tax=Octopus bimaculoides TaxID=37653 RepID=A0A0L8H329_OCTBM